MPGARAGVTTFGVADERWRAIDELFSAFLPQPRADSRTSGPLGSGEGVARLLSDAGLVDVRTVHRMVEAHFSGPEQWLEFSWSHGSRALWEAVAQERRGELRERAYEHLQALAIDTGRLSTTQDVRHTLGRRP